MSRHQSTFEERPGVPHLQGAQYVETWLRGEADLRWAAMRRPVPVEVLVAVLAHGDLIRLRNLGRLARRATVRRMWGQAMAETAGHVADLARDAAGLRLLQETVLEPLEDDLLAGRRRFIDREDAAMYIQHRLLAS